MPDALHVYSVACAWHGPIEKVGSLSTPARTISVGNGREVKIPASSLPCCPHCKSVLYQIDEREWQEGAMKHNKTHPGYINLLEWIEKQPRCYPTFREAAFAFSQKTGVTVKFD